MVEIVVHVEEASLFSCHEKLELNSNISFGVCLILILTGRMSVQCSGSKLVVPSQKQSPTSCRWVDIRTRSYGIPFIHVLASPTGKGGHKCLLSRLPHRKLLWANHTSEGKGLWNCHQFAPSASSGERPWYIYLYG